MIFQKRITYIIHTLNYIITIWSGNTSPTQSNLYEDYITYLIYVITKVQLIIVISLPSIR